MRPFIKAFVDFQAIRRSLSFWPNIAACEIGSVYRHIPSNRSSLGPILIGNEPARGQASKMGRSSLHHEKLGERSRWHCIWGFAGCPEVHRSRVY